MTQSESLGSAASKALPPKGALSITSYLGVLRDSQVRFDYTPLEVYLAVCRAAPNASAATKRKWKKVLGFGELYG